uniref:Ribosomal RNA-processing protein 7 C-terminal domain-containing protein n=1 Tax=Ditylum brightwellii TaxID=49249 RepID=A0A6V2NIU2_9STRA|mmetsp:Transcript_28209/g.37545  ORF Transcript_28209/g.37545 Transcript_28209/m.37545 type:complete len:204 (+) Transcript_28209:66-677(+)
MSTSLPYLRLLAIAVLCQDLSFVHSFSNAAGSLQQQRNIRPRNHRTSRLLSSADDDISRQIAKAKELVATAKAKMAKKEEEQKAAAEKDDDPALFFASDPSPSKAKGDGSQKREKVVKTKNEESGLITTDGELMASLSESEEWEVRPLSQVFKSEIEGKKSDSASKKFERDIAQSMMGLKRKMKKEDYERIFDKRNFFIGEEN